MSHALDTTSKILEQPKSTSHRVGEALMVAGALSLGVAAATLLKPRKSDWETPDNDAQNAVKTGLMVGALVLGIAGASKLTIDAVMNPTIKFDNPNYIEPKEDESKVG